MTPFMLLANRRLATLAPAFMLGLAIAWIVFALPARSQSSFQRRQPLPEVSLDRLVAPPDARIFGRAVREAVPATLTGRARPVSESVRATLAAWFSKDPRGADMAVLLDQEIEVTDGRLLLWIPASLASEAARRGKAGDRVTLVVERVAQPSGGPVPVAIAVEWGDMNRTFEYAGEIEALTGPLRLRYARAFIERIRECAVRLRDARGYPALLTPADRPAGRCLPPEILDREVFGYRFLYRPAPPGMDGIARLYFACAFPAKPNSDSAAVAGDEESVLPPLAIPTMGRIGDCMAPWAHAGGAFALRAIKNCLIHWAAVRRERGLPQEYPADLAAWANSPSGCEGESFVVAAPDTIVAGGQTVRYRPRRHDTSAPASGFVLAMEQQHAAGTFMYLDDGGGVRIAYGRAAGPADNTLEEELRRQNIDAEQAKAGRDADLQGCTQGQADFCNQAAFRSWIARDSVAAIPLWKRSCELGNLEGCVMAQARPFGIDGFNRILAQRRACFRGEADACARIGIAVAEAAESDACRKTNCTLPPGGRNERVSPSGFGAPR